MQKRFLLNKAERIIRLIGLSATVAMLFIAKFFIFPPSLSDNTNATISDPVPSETTVSLSVGDGPIAMDLMPNSSEGTFKESDAVAIDVTTNNISGYTLQIASNTTVGASSLINSDEDCVNITSDKSKCVIDTIPTAITVSNYASSNSNNNWGYKPSQYVITENNTTSTINNNTGDNTQDKYLPAPSSSGDILAITSNANNIDSNTNEQEIDSYSIKIGSRVDTTMPAGTYQNTFIITAVGNLVNYTITYNANAGTDTVTNMPNPNPQTGAVSGSETLISLDDSTPSRENYYFLGWCTQTTSDATCSGNIYQPGGSFGIDQTISNDNIALYAIWADCPPNSICYNDNGANSTTQMGEQTATSNSSVTLMASNFQRDGYGFLGWSEDADAAAKLTDDDPTNTPTIYGPNETITTGDLSIEGTKFYAVWLQSQGNIQNFQCSSLSNVGDVTAQLDTRDNNVYAIAKLADGNCWMIENLRLDNSASVDYPALAQGYGGLFSGLAASENNTFEDTVVSNSRYKSDGSGNIVDVGSATHTDIGLNNGPQYRMPRFNNDNTFATANSADSGNTNIYSYGNYYSWAAAIANTTYYDNYVSSDSAGTSLCPDGWQLPLGAERSSTDKSFSYLGYSLNGNGGSQSTTEASSLWRKFPNNFLYSGYFDSHGGADTPSSRGESGGLWTSSAADASYAYFFSIASFSLQPGTNSNYKYYGLPVRCIANN